MFGESRVSSDVAERVPFWKSTVLRRRRSARFQRRLVVCGNCLWRPTQPAHMQCARARTCRHAAPFRIEEWVNEALLRYALSGTNGLPCSTTFRIRQALLVGRSRPEISYLVPGHCALRHAERDRYEDGILKRTLAQHCCRHADGASTPYQRAFSANGDHVLDPSTSLVRARSRLNE